MVEMQETATILHNFTERSLLILDEVGRGTATTDGLSIAWAVIEYLHGVGDKGPKTLFATHYHELISLAKSLNRIRNYNVAVKDEGNDVVFLHKIQQGGLDRSYGIHVAQLAGIPQKVIQRSTAILEQLTKDKNSEDNLTPQPIDTSKSQIPLFTVHQEDHPVIRKLDDLDINSTTPLDALQTLNDIKKMLKK